MNTLSIQNPCQFKIEQFPNDILLKIFSPKEIACILPYVSKILKRLANDNDLWNSISIKFRTIHLKLEIPFDYNNAKFSYIMRNIEISNMFENNVYPLNFQKDVKIDKYGLNFYNFDLINHRLNSMELYTRVFSSYKLKILQFMLDFCQNTSIDGYLAKFISDEKAIIMIMRDYQTILEKEYHVHKALIDRIDSMRLKNNKPVPKNMNKAESMARSLVNTYEKSLQIFNASTHSRNF